MTQKINSGEKLWGHIPTFFTSLQFAFTQSRMYGLHYFFMILKHVAFLSVQKGPHHHSNKADNIDGGTRMKMKKLSWLSLNLPDACMLLHLEEKKKERKKKKRENLFFWHTDPALFFPHDWWICLKWVIGKVYPKYYQNNAFPQALLHWPTAAMMHGWLQYSMQ